MKRTLSIAVVLVALTFQLNSVVARAGQSRLQGFGEGREYDMTRKITIQGFITKLETGTDKRNPVHIGLNVTDQSGKITNWMVAGPTQIQIDSNSLGEFFKVGARLKVTGAPLRDRTKSTSADTVGKDRVYGTTFTVANGREYSWP